MRKTGNPTHRAGAWQRRRFGHGAANPYNAAMKWAILPLWLLVAGCANIVVPPTQPQEPVTVYLLDHGRHPTLVLPTREGHYIRYAYGDWNWYALNHTSTGTGLAALFWPTPGTLGRKELADWNAVEQTATHRDPVQNFYKLQVDQRAVDRLLEELDSKFQRKIETEHYNPICDLDFIRTDDTYTWLHNCDHVMAHWLEELGCRVYGTHILSVWVIRPPS